MTISRKLIAETTNIMVIKIIKMTFNDLLKEKRISKLFETLNSWTVNKASPMINLLRITS